MVFLCGVIILTKNTMQEKQKFVEHFRERTRQMALQCIAICQALPRTAEAGIVGRQLVRSATSCAANYRAACRARSRAEFYAKISIVIEEADESIFWIEMIEASGMYRSQMLDQVTNEITDIIKVMSKARKTISNSK
jgi:four helix bundle protein